MSRLNNAVKRQKATIPPKDAVINFMNGISYKPDPIQTLKMIAASSIFGEPSYYRDGGLLDHRVQKCCMAHLKYVRFNIEMLFEELVKDKTTTEVFESAIDAALEYDFTATLDLAKSLRHDYNMRLNPQIIMVRAAIHPARTEWTKHNKGKFTQYEYWVMHRGDEPAVQVAYYLYLNGGKKSGMPSILKRAIADKLASLSAYDINKYKNAEIGMINAVRIVHAHSEKLDELMQNGTIQTEDSNLTWEQLRSNGVPWIEIIKSVNDGNLHMGHMALLRNLRNMFSVLDEQNPQDRIYAEMLMTQLKQGVASGKQFPFRYEAAHKAILAESNIAFKSELLDAIKDCMELSISNLPRLRGKTVCLTDNSGSAWGSVTSEYGTTTIANIDNLSSVIAVKCSDTGSVIKFGDTYVEYPISKIDSIMTSAERIDADRSDNVGGATESGIWQYLRDAIQNKIWIDNLFIFSDQQAGTGGLYGTPEDARMYASLGYANQSCGYPFIDVYSLVNAYRREVNPEVNVFSVQTAGYDNSVLPAMAYRCAILTGWTGKEIAFAAEYINQWNEIDAPRMPANNPEFNKNL